MIYLGVVHKLHTLVMQNIPTIGKSRDMSRIYIALQGYTDNSFHPDHTYMQLSKSCGITPVRL